MGDDQRLRELTQSVSGSELMQHLRELARWVKLPASRDEAASLHYIRERLTAYGFATELLSHDAYISIPGRARVVIDGQDCTCITHSFSRATPAPGLTADLIYVGAGTDRDFRQTDVRGRIVLVDGLAAPAVTDRASRAGAAGQLHISPDQHLHEMCLSPVWGSPAASQQADLPATVVCTIPPAAGEPLRDRLRSGEQPGVTMHAAVDTAWHETPILVADLEPPSGLRDPPFVLFSGHHDTWHYGVMDNGSANATMLEVARLCARQRPAWRRGLRMCFWSGHSQGRYSGSTWYADTHWDELDRRCIAHINVDSTGARGAEILSNVRSMAILSGLAAEAVLEQGGQALAGHRMSRGADQSFNGIGLPALFGDLSEPPASSLGPHCWWWHTPDDLLDKIDETLLVRDTRVYVHALWRLLTDLVLPLDYLPFADSLLAELNHLRTALEKPCPIAPLIAAVEDLRRLAARMRQRAATTSAADAPIINRALMRAARALVPIDYTSGDRFAHDPALAQPAFPTLETLRALAAVAPGSDDARALAVDAIRARNRVLYALREANLALAAADVDSGQAIMA